MMPSPFTGSAEEQKRMKQHSPPKAFECYLKEVERITNEAARPSPTPMASSPTALPATTRLDGGSDSHVTTMLQLFVGSTKRQPTNNNQPINQINPINQSNQTINSSNPTNLINPINHPTLLYILPTHQSCQLLNHNTAQRSRQLRLTCNERWQTCEF